MKTVLYRVLWVIWMAICLSVLTQGRARAGDCSGPDDCGAIPDNATKAAAAGGALAGAAVATRKKKEEDDPTYGSGEASDLEAIFGKPDQTPSEPEPETGETDPEPKPSEAKPGGKDDIFNRPLGE